MRFVGSNASFSSLHAETTVGQGSSRKIDGKGNLQKTSKSLPIFCFLFSNNIHLKNNNRND